MLRRIPSAANLGSATPPYGFHNRGDPVIEQGLHDFHQVHLEWCDVDGADSSTVPYKDRRDLYTWRLPVCHPMSAYVIPRRRD